MTKSANSHLPAALRRRSGVLLHPTSLRGGFGTGDLGREAHGFVEFLARARQSYWQMLPVNPLGAGNSPYDSNSAFAGNPLLVDLDALRRRGWLRPRELEQLPAASRADYRRSSSLRDAALRLAWQRCAAGAARGRRGLDEFREAERSWLEDYALFAALKRSARRLHWWQWDTDLRRRKPAALLHAQQRLASEIDFQVFVQWQFRASWDALRQHALACRVELLGDVPMFVAHDSADVWQNQELFLLDRRGHPLGVAGAPPDAFSASGQLWGNPPYRWSALMASGFDWWVRRLAHNLRQFDLLRLDHFIGFSRFWQVAPHAKSARRGRFVSVPGDALLETTRRALGGLPFVAEDLGVLTPEIHALRERFGLPGMRVLQFAFGSDEANDYQPHRYIDNCFVYTGTHDNDTLLGWFGSLGRKGSSKRREAERREKQRALAYSGGRGDEIEWSFVRLAMMSVARVSIFPLQDLLGLGSSARMNLPGTGRGNWTWRLSAADHARLPRIAERLASMTSLYERSDQHLQRSRPQDL